ncbi:hypothetical protein HanPSC8_Chr06g0261611 [Helianthus annuus]|nr:hypothetical protein HanPSC8_Chr06g0261611 [Helianthus annuus]
MEEKRSSDARYFVEAGRRSSSTKNRTRYSYMLPHFATLSILNNELRSRYVD